MIRHITKHQVARYIIGGGTSAVVNLATLYIFASILHVYYLIASVFAFLTAFLISWAFHKFWTFKDTSMKGAHKQIALYLTTSLLSLCVNTIIVYVSVSKMGASVLVGQIIAGIIVACFTFFISKYVVFRTTPETTEKVLNDFL